MSLRTLALLSLLAASHAHADPIELVPTCVAIDESRDALSSLERAQASQMLKHVLEQQDLLVVESGCVDTYTLAHEHENGRLLIHVHGPHGSRRLRVAAFADLPDAYRRMVTSLREGPAPAPSAPVEAYAPPAPPEPSVAAPALSPLLDVAEPPRDEPAVDAPSTRAHSVFYAQLGVGGMAGGDSPRSFGAGYRYETIGMVFDAAFTAFSSDSSGTRPVSGTRLAGKLLRELTPDSAASLYLGGGLGLGGSTIEAGGGSAYDGSGLEGIATIGADWRRDHTGVRMFAQADLILPFYTMQLDQTATTQYGAAFMVSVGLGTAIAH